MAERYAISAGNWVAARFDGGTLPGVGDTVHANNFAVTIDTTITVDALSTRPGAVAVAGGSFTTSGSVTVNADSYAGTTTCLTMTAGAIQNGDSYGSNTTNSRYGSRITRGIQNGNAYGGNGNGRNGSFLTDAATLNGNSYGGTAAGAWGAQFTTSSIQNGNAYGSDTAGTYGSYLEGARCAINGNTYGGAAALAFGAALLRSAHIGNSFGGSGSDSRGSDLAIGAVQNGDAYGGSGASAHGTSTNEGAIVYGQQIGSTTISSAYGLLLQGGSVCITTGITTNTAAGLRLVNDSTVILQNGTTAGQVSNAAAAGRFEIAESSNSYPFVGGSGVAGFTGIRGTTRTLGT